MVVRFNICLTVRDFVCQRVCVRASVPRLLAPNSAHTPCQNNLADGGHTDTHRRSTSIVQQTGMDNVLCVRAIGPQRIIYLIVESFVCQRISCNHNFSCCLSESNMLEMSPLYSHRIYQRWQIVSFAILVLCVRPSG